MHHFCADLLKHIINFKLEDVFFLLFCGGDIQILCYFILTFNQRSVSVALIYSRNEKEHLSEKCILEISFHPSCFRRFSIISFFRQSSMFLRKGLKANDLYLKRKGWGQLNHFSDTVGHRESKRPAPHNLLITVFNVKDEYHRI